MMSNDEANSEDVITGISASEGIAIGKVHVLDKKKRQVLPKSILESHIDQHKDRFKKARELLTQELDEMLAHLDQASSEIIESQKHIALDPEIERRVFEVIEADLLGADYAVYTTYCLFIEKLKESGSELFQQRIIDLENLRDRLVDLVCDDTKSIEVKKGAIVVAKELSPTELVALHENGIEGLVMEKGGVTSHAALIAQSLGIPCIVNAKNAISRAEEGKVILDGREGLLFLKPTKEEFTFYKAKLAKLKRKRKRLLKNATEPSKTKSGTPFTLLANLEFLSEAAQVNSYHASGVGLLRTEGLLFSGRVSESEQEHFYEKLLKDVSGVLVVRLFDVGGDKVGLRHVEESNPFLGWRGIRMLLDERAMFTTQLKALLKVAGQYPKRVKILVPMISVEEEIVEVKRTIDEVQKELASEGQQIDSDIPLGIMIEVPSAALIADKLAKHVEFFSIGTNDLTQYTLAVDRGNERICTLYQQQHPAIWRLIKITIDAARANNIDISVCGELAGSPLGASGLLGLGVTELSMIPSFIPRVKEELISHTDEEFKSLSAQILDSSSTAQVLDIFEKWRNH